MGGNSRTADAVVNAMTRIAIKVMPRMPDGLKRLLLRRRSITVDADTLDARCS